MKLLFLTEKNRVGDRTYNQPNLTGFHYIGSTVSVLCRVSKEKGPRTDNVVCGRESGERAVSGTFCYRDGRDDGTRGTKVFEGLLVSASRKRFTNHLPHLIY